MSNILDYMDGSFDLEDEGDDWSDFWSQLGLGEEGADAFGDEYLGDNFLNTPDTPAIGDESLMFGDPVGGDSLAGYGVAKPITGFVPTEPVPDPNYVSINEHPDRFPTLGDGDLLNNAQLNDIFGILTGYKGPTYDDGTPVPYGKQGTFGADPTMDGGWHRAPQPGGGGPSPARPTGAPTGQAGRGGIIGDILNGDVSNVIDIPNRKYPSIQDAASIYGVSQLPGLINPNRPTTPRPTAQAPTSMQNPVAPRVTGGPTPVDSVVNTQTGPIDTTNVDVTTPTPGDPDVQTPTTNTGTETVSDILDPGTGTTPDPGTTPGDGLDGDGDGNNGDGGGGDGGDGDGGDGGNGGNNVPEITPYQNQYITGDPQNKILPWAIADQPNMDTYLNSVMDMEANLNPRQTNQMKTDYGAMTGQDMSGGIGDRDDQILAGILGQANAASGTANELRSGAGQLTEEELRRLREQAAAMAQGRGMVNSPAMMQDMLDRTSMEQYRMRSQDTDRALQHSTAASGMYGQAGAAQTNILNGILGVGNQIGIDPSTGIDIAGADMGNYFGLESANRLAHASEQQGKVGLGMDLLGMGLDYFNNRNKD